MQSFLVAQIAQVFYIVVLFIIIFCVFSSYMKVRKLFSESSTRERKKKRVYISNVVGEIICNVCVVIVLFAIVLFFMVNFR